MFESQTEIAIGQARQALICLEAEEDVHALATTLTEMGFSPKGCSVERDVVLAIRNDHYDVMVFPDHFSRGDITTNAVLRELAEMSSEDRRHQYCVVTGKNMKSNSQLQAFRLSVDQVINDADIADCAELLQQGMARKQRAVFALVEMQQIVGSE